MKYALALSILILFAVLIYVSNWFFTISINSEFIFDKAAANTKISFQFTINNSTFKEVEITNYQTGCPCNSLNVMEQPGILKSLRGTFIKPRSQVTVYAFFTVIPESGQTFYQKNVMIATSCPEVPQLRTTIKVKQVTGKIEARPDVLSITYAKIGRTTEQKLTIFNATSDKCIITNVECTGSVVFDFSKMILPLEIQPSQAKELCFTAVPSQYGFLEGKIAFYCHEDVISVPYTARVSGYTSISKPIVFFPVDKVADPDNATVLARSEQDIDAVFNAKIDDQRVNLQWERLDAQTFKALVIISSQHRFSSFSTEVIIAIQTKKGVELHTLRVRNMPKTDQNKLQTSNES